MSRWKQVAIVGVGLIGGSIGRALLARELAERVIGVGRSDEKLARAQEAGVITDYATSLAAAAEKADVIVICTPVELVARTVELAAAHCGKKTLITDAGSTKVEIVAEVESQELPAGRFVGSHPMAGSELTGFENSDPDLFVDRLTILTPTEKTPPQAVQAAEEFWQALESTTVAMSPAEHDEIVAEVSHVPHLIASVLAAATSAEKLPYASTGFADTTRVAAGDVELWRQILLGNQAGVLKGLSIFERLLASMRKALEDRDSATVAQILSQGKSNRDVVGSRNTASRKSAESSGR